MSRIKAIIVDLDGTLCDTTHRNHLIDYDNIQSTDWTAWEALASNDKVNDWCRNLMKIYDAAHYHIIIVTGRMGVTDTVNNTEDWLNKHAIPYDGIFFRLDCDEKDYEYKVRTYKEHISKDYDVDFIIDDNLNICKEFEKIGIRSLRCATY